ncbi:MAG: hypothetical protein H0V82_02450 [Candidatus Protochlamydia sp.]|nr:hypothetical protein [Candidatus Protochlamydia sp.]
MNDLNSNSSYGYQHFNTNSSSEELINLIEELNSFIITASWENTNISIINNLINNNLSLIFSQTQNNDTAPQLKKVLLDLSKRIFDENCGSAANNLAYEVQCYAMGLLRDESLSESKFTEDVLKIIFPQLLPKQLGPYFPLHGMLKSPTLVSKDWHKFSNEVKYKWVSQEGISLRKLAIVKQQKRQWIL